MSHLFLKTMLLICTAAAVDAVPVTVKPEYNSIEVEQTVLLYYQF